MPVESLRIALGSRLPWFDVLDLQGKRWTTATLPTHKALLVAFLCNHSPYVVHIEQSLGAVAKELRLRGVFLLGLASNDERAYPADCRDKLEEQVARAKWDFPYAIDENQRAAKAFRATCTPEFFLYDADWRLAYHGQYDSARPASADEAGVTGNDLESAVSAVLLGEPVARRQVAAFGCSIKWRAGNEPSYIFTHLNPQDRPR